jgi:hypothetical protein
MRLRQVVLVAPTLEPAVGTLRRLFQLGEGFRDPGVAEFGLVNTVFALGDTFLEVVAPKADGTTAGRYLERRGEGGYMVIVQVDSIEDARRRVEELGVRVVWQSEHEEISGLHLHPRDVGGAILSLDEARPPESWHWAGPRWLDEVDTSVVGEILAVELQAASPAGMARRWGRVLARAPKRRAGVWTIPLDRGSIRFVPARDGRGEGVSRFDVAVTDRERLLANAEELDIEVASDGDILETAGVRIGLCDRDRLADGDEGEP